MCVRNDLVGDGIINDLIWNDEGPTESHSFVWKIELSKFFWLNNCYIKPLMEVLKLNNPLV